MGEHVVAVTQEHGEIVVDRPDRPHPIGPGPYPDLREEPVAFAIWQALLGVRDAWGWADVARQVEAKLRARGLVGDVHERLRAAERERDLALVERNTAVAQLRAHHAREARAADPVQGYLDRLRAMDPSPRMLTHIEEIEAERRVGRG